jgi:hypothetical protein
MTAAERSRRYRARRKASRVTVPESSPVERVTAALDTLCDLVEAVTPAELIEQTGPVAMMGLAGDTELCSAWLGAVATLASAAVKRGRPG